MPGTGMFDGPSLWMLVVGGAVLAAVLVSFSSLREWMRQAQRNRFVRPVSPAGWLSDPAGRHESRYWDGTDWTARVRDADRDSEDPI
jgi:hypothetical protein